LISPRQSVIGFEAIDDLDRGAVALDRPAYERFAWIFDGLKG
jgi:hypothetical protein